VAFSVGSELATEHGGVARDTTVRRCSCRHVARVLCRRRRRCKSAVGHAPPGDLHCEDDDATATRQLKAASCGCFHQIHTAQRSSDVVVSSTGDWHALKDSSCVTNSLCSAGVLLQLTSDAVRQQVGLSKIFAAAEAAACYDYIGHHCPRQVTGRPEPKARRMSGQQSPAIAYSPSDACTSVSRLLYKNNAAAVRKLYTYTQKYLHMHSRLEMCIFCLPITYRLRSKTCRRSAGSAAVLQKAFQVHVYRHQLAVSESKPSSRCLSVVHVFTAGVNQSTILTVHVRSILLTA